MIKTGNIFLILLIILSHATSGAASNKKIEKQEQAQNTEQLEFLDSELAKDNVTNLKQSSDKTATIKKKELKSSKKATKATDVSTKIAPSKEPNRSNNTKQPSSYIDYSWVPKLNRDPTNESKARLEQYKKEQEELVDSLLAINYNTYTPPKQLYNLSNDSQNKHLPHVYLKSDYFDMVFKAVDNDDEDGLRAILSGANFLNQQNKDGDTILIYAIQNHKLNLARILLAKGALVDFINYRQRSALHYAAALGDIEAVRLLLSMGANLNLRDDMNLTPIDYALLEKHYQVEDMIKQYLEAK